MATRRTCGAAAPMTTAKASILGSADPILNAVDCEIAWLIEYEGRAVRRNGCKSKRQKLDWSYLATLASEATGKHIRKHQPKPQFQNMATILLIQNHKRKAFRELRDRIQNHVSPSSAIVPRNPSGRSSGTSRQLRPPTISATGTNYRMNGAVSSVNQRWAIASRSTMRGLFSGDQCSLSHLRLSTHEQDGQLADSSAIELDNVISTGTEDGNDHHLRVVLHRKRSREKKAAEWLVEDPEAPIQLSVRIGTVGVYQNLEAENPIQSSHFEDDTSHNRQRRSPRRQQNVLDPTHAELAELWLQSERASKTGKVNWIDVKECASEELRDILEDAMEAAHFSTNPLEVLVDVKERRRFLAYQAHLESSNATCFSIQKQNKRQAKEMKETTTTNVEDGDSRVEYSHDNSVCRRKQYHAPGDVVQFRWLEKKEDGDQESWVKGVIQSFNVVSATTEDDRQVRTYNIKRMDSLTDNPITLPNVPEIVVHADEDATILQQGLKFKGIRVMVDSTSRDLYLRRRGWYETDLTGSRVFCSLSHAMRERDDALFRKCRSKGKNQRSVMLNEMNLLDEWQARKPPKPKPKPPPMEHHNQEDCGQPTTTESVCGSASEGATTKCEESTAATTVSSTVDNNSRSGPPRRWSPELFGPLLSAKKEKLLTSPVKELAFLLELSKEGNGITSWSYVLKAAKSPELDSIFKAGKRSSFWQTQKIKALIGDDRTLRDAFRLYRDKVQEKVQEMNDGVIDEDDEVVDEEEDGFPLDRQVRRMSVTSPAAATRKCPPWTPGLYTNMGVPSNLEQVLTKEEKELAYLLEIGRGRSGKFLWEWVLQQDMSPTLAKLIEAASSADNQYWERQKLKSLIGCGKIKNEAMKVYREGLKRRLQDLQSKGVFDNQKNRKSAASNLKPPATASIVLSSANSSSLMQELAFHYGQSMFHFGRVEHSYILAHSTQTLLKHYIATHHPSTNNKWNLVSNKGSAKLFDCLCKESLETARAGSTPSTLYLTSPRNGPRVQICFLSFEELVGDEDVVKPEHLSPEHVELAFLMEKSAMLNNSSVQWCYVEAHYKSAALTDLWSTKAQLQAFFTNRLQYLVGRNERRLETFRTARSKLKKMMLQAMGTTRAAPCGSGSKRKATAAVLSPPPTPSYRPSFSTSPLSSSPKRQRKFMRDSARRYMDSLVCFSRSGVVAKAKFANDLLSLVRSHHTLKNGKQDKPRTSLSSLFKRQELKLRALESNIVDTVMKHVDEDEDPELEFEASTYLNLRDSQFMAFCDQLVQTWKNFEGNVNTDEDLFDELEATQRTLWDYHLRAEEATLELHTVKISGLK